MLTWVIACYICFYYITPTPSEAIKSKVLLELAPSIHELGTSSHSVIKVSIPVLTALLVREFIATSCPMRAVNTAMPAIFIEFSPFTTIHMLILTRIALACSVKQLAFVALVGIVAAADINK